jgi:hypothetical protein
VKKPKPNTILMKTHENKPGHNHENIVLKELVDLLLLSFRSETLKQNSTAVNSIPSGFKVSTDEHILAGVLSSLFGTLIHNCPHSHFSISVRSCNNIVLLRIGNDRMAKAGESLRKLKSLRLFADKMGGSISLVNPGTKDSAILVSFIRFREESSVSAFQLPVAS